MNFLFSFFFIFETLTLSLSTTHPHFFHDNDGFSQAKLFYIVISCKAIESLKQQQQYLRPQTSLVLTFEKHNNVSTGRRWFGNDIFISKFILQLLLEINEPNNWHLQNENLASKVQFLKLAYLNIYLMWICIFY